ncbi:zf-HC2 domain-containing protein [Microtetraspora sp. AC03309]|uniref:anti-sigma factor family protein n=1 Tax=Microtetraspora sp. AC03309 TaxID=2779376 RepID=UPI001E481BD2|nr:zf-HC2 domain-containing protein [Microtetraspora sp. AC03309]MCC5579691.1 zf-HC2 domain-containing protein [Microtetraspora sp. AC03309]
MTCEDVRISLGVYVLGALDTEETAEVEAHLDDCPDCLAELAELSGLPPLLARVSEEDIRHAADPPREMLDRLLTATVRRRRRSRVMLALAASVVVAALGGTTWATTVAQHAADSSAGGSSTVSTMARPEEAASAAADSAAADSAAADIGAGGMGDVARKTQPSGASDEPVQTLVAPTVKSAKRGNVELRVELTPGEGGTRVVATVTGLRSGVVCHLTAVGMDGTVSGVASWKATAQGYAPTTVTFDGSTELTEDKIRHFTLTTAEGRTLVTVRM